MERMGVRGVETERTGVGQLKILHVFLKMWTFELSCAKLGKSDISQTHQIRKSFGFGFMINDS